MGNASNKKKNKEGNGKKEKEKTKKSKNKDLLIIMPKNDKEYTFPAENEIPSHYLFSEEEKDLLEFKKKALEAQFGTMRRNLSGLNDINDIFSTKTEKNISINTKTIRNDCGQCFLCLNFNVLGPLFVILNLIGIHQLIWLYKSTLKEITIGINTLAFNKTRNITADEIYSDYSFNNIPDFKLFFLSSIIGNFFLKFCGYKISTLVFMILNAGNIFFILFSNSFPYQYDAHKLGLVFLYFITLFFSVGSITLIPHSIYFDGLRKYNDYNYYVNYDDDNNQSFFFYLCITEIPAYLINVMINYILKKKKYYDKINNYYICSIIIYEVFSASSILVYIIYSLAFKKNRKNSENENISINACRILGYLFFYEKKKQGFKNNSRRKKDNLKIEEQNLELFKNNIKAKNHYSNVIIRYIPFSDLNNIQNYLTNIEEHLDLADYEIIENKRDIIENDYNEIDSNGINDYNEVLIDYAKDDKVIHCFGCRLGLKKCFNKSQEDSICLNVCCCNCCEFCCGFDDPRLSELNQGDEQFCYLYKIQRKFSWFCDLLFKNNILDFLIENIFLELMTIGFTKELNKNFQYKNFNEKFITIIVYICCFFIFTVLNKFLGNINITKCCLSKLNEKFDFDKLEDFHKQINNIVILVLSNIIIITIFSGFSLFGTGSGLSDFTNKYLIILPFALTKFYNFILMNCLVNLMDENNIDILSSSTIISLFLLIYNLFSYILTDFLDISENSLILFQFIIGLICLSLVIIAIVILVLIIVFSAIFATICCCLYCCSKSK